jgi:hypothetical protein
VASAAETLEPRADVTIIVEGIMLGVAAGGKRSCQARWPSSSPRLDRLVICPTPGGIPPRARSLPSARRQCPLPPARLSTSWPVGSSICRRSARPGRRRRWSLASEVIVPAHAAAGPELPAVAAETVQLALHPGKAVNQQS